MGLRLSPSKTRIAHLADGVDFLGFRIVWQRKRGTNKWHVYTFIADKPVQALKRKIKSLTRLSHMSYRETLVKINYIQRGWLTTSSTRLRSTPSSTCRTSSGGE